MPTGGASRAGGVAPTLGQGLAVLLLGGVQVVHVGRVVLAVVQLHDLRVDVRLQRAIVVRQVREAVLMPGARGRRRRGQPPAGAEGTERTPPPLGRRHRVPDTPAAPRPTPRRTPRPRDPAAHLQAARHNMLRCPRPLLSSEYGRSLSSARLLCSAASAQRPQGQSARRGLCRPLPSAEGGR